MEITEERLSDRTRRSMGRAHFLVAGVFFGTGLLKGSGPVVAVSLFIIVLPIAFWLMHRRFLGSITLKRRMPEGQYEGQPVRVEVIVQNRTFLPVFMPEIEDHFTAEPMMTKWTFHPGWLHAWRRMTVRYSAEARGPRGEYIIGPAKLSVIDPLGLSQASFVYQDSDLLTVYPQVYPIRQMPFESARSRFSLQLKSTTKASLGQEFYGVRDWRRGDSMRHIHWRSTARLRRLIVKEFEMPASKNVYLFLDLCEKTARGMGHRSAIEYSIRAAASILTHAIESNHCVGLYAHGQIPVEIPPIGGMHQLQRLMRLLVAARQTGPTPFDELLLENLAAITIDSAVVLIFPTSMLDLDRYAHAISVLQGRGVTLTAVLIDDRTFYRTHGDMLDYREEQEIDQVVRKLAALGLAVYVLGERRNPEEAFRAPVYAK